MSAREIVKKNLTEFEMKRWDEIYAEIEECQALEMENLKELTKIRKRQNLAMRKMEQFWNFNRSLK